TEGNIVFLDASSGEAGTIQYSEVSLSREGSKQVVVRGQLLAGLIGRRITCPPPGKAYDYVNANIETIMKHYVDANCVNPTDPKRVIPDLTIASDQQRGGQIQCHTRYKPLAEE